MLKEIRKKRASIMANTPLEPEVKKVIKRINLEDMAFSALRLSGSALTREDVQNMLDGNVSKETTIIDNLTIDRYQRLQEEMNDMLEMGNSLNLRTINRLYAVISGQEPAEISYRQNNPVIYELAYNPPSAQSVGQLMEEFSKKVNSPKEEAESNELLKAVEIHNRIIEIWPFDNQTTELARVCLYYYLMSEGYPVFTFNFSEKEYQTAIMAYMVNEDILPFYSGIERSLYNKLEQVLQIIAED